MRLKIWPHSAVS